MVTGSEEVPGYDGDHGLSVAKSARNIRGSEQRPQWSVKLLVYNTRTENGGGFLVVDVGDFKYEMGCGKTRGGKEIR